MWIHLPFLCLCAGLALAQRVDHDDANRFPRAIVVTTNSSSFSLTTAPSTASSASLGLSSSSSSSASQDGSSTASATTTSPGLPPSSSSQTNPATQETGSSSISNGATGIDTAVPPVSALPTLSLTAASIDLPLTGTLLSSVSLPSVSLPSVSLPSVSASLPSVSLPSASLPSASLPSVSLPSVSLPSVTLPSVTLPSVSLSSVSLPSLSLPTSLSLPSVTLSTRPFTGTRVSAADISSFPTLSLSGLSGKFNQTTPTVAFPVPGSHETLTFAFSLTGPNTGTGPVTPIKTSSTKMSTSTTRSSLSTTATHSTSHTASPSTSHATSSSSLSSSSSVSSGSSTRSTTTPHTSNGILSSLYGSHTGTGNAGAGIPSPTTSPVAAPATDEGKGPSKPAIAGIAVGGGTVIFVCLVAIVYLLRRRYVAKQNEKRTSVYPEEAYLYDPPVPPTIGTETHAADNRHFRPEYTESYSGFGGNPHMSEMIAAGGVFPAAAYGTSGSRGTSPERGERDGLIQNGAQFGGSPFAAPTRSPRRNSSHVAPDAVHYPSSYQQLHEQDPVMPPHPSPPFGPTHSVPPIGQVKNLWEEVDLDVAGGSAAAVARNYSMGKATMVDVAGKKKKGSEASSLTSKRSSEMQFADPRLIGKRF